MVGGNACSVTPERESMSKTVFIIGGAQTDFSRNYSREELTIFDLLR